MTKIRKHSAARCILATGLAWLALAGGALAFDKSGVKPNSISLPTGPGSIEGLGESFQPTLNTGTAKYSVKLTVPPGTAGHAPDLALEYDGGGSNGVLGFGWTLGVPAVRRQTDKGIPRYVDAPNGVDDDLDGKTDEADELDVFIDSGNEELVPHANADGIHIDYFCKNEGAFVRYRRLDNGGWEGVQPDGTRMEFGVTLDGRIDHPEGKGTYCWLVEQIIDTNGNTIVFSYETYLGEENTNQKYLHRIEYGPGAPRWGGNFHFVHFDYKENGKLKPRTDWFEDCRSGFSIRTGVILREITMGTQGPVIDGHLQGDFNGDGVTDNLVRRYVLEYGAHPHWSLLTRVTLWGADNQTSLPSTTFDYTVCAPAETIYTAGEIIGNIKEPDHLPYQESVDLADLNGDGLPDVLRTLSTGREHTAFLNQGESQQGSDHVITWSDETTLSTADESAWYVDLSSTGDIAHLADMDGDGIADLVHKSVMGRVYYYKNTAKMGWAEEQLMVTRGKSADSVPPAPFGTDKDVKTADVDFNKHIDVIQSAPVGDGVEYQIWYNLGDNRYSDKQTAKYDAGYRLSQEGTEIADFNGDRVPDIVHIDTGTVYVMAGLGYGNFAPPQPVDLPDSGIDPQWIKDEKVKLTDINGDGLVDLVVERAQAGVLWYWLNLGNYTFDTRRSIVDMPTGLGVDAKVRWADMNGNGTTDIAYFSRDREPHMQTVDIGRLMGCVPKPNMLVKINNGIGCITTVTYDTSTTFALRDAQANPAVPWPDPLPFPVSVVSQVFTDDSLGNQYVTKFQYHNGFYDGKEKEFRGFARVEQIDVGDDDGRPADQISAPTLVTRHLFDTGCNTETMKGKPLRQLAQTKAALDDPVLDSDPNRTSAVPEHTFWDESTQWTVKDLMTGIDGQIARHARPTLKRRHVIELGQGDPAELGPKNERLIETEFEFDDYGNQTMLKEFGVVQDGDRSAFNDERITKTEFAYNIDKWLVCFEAREELTDLAGHIISRSDTYYDDKSFAGIGLGAVAVGNVTLVREWVDPTTDGTFVETQRTKHDEYGNPVTLLDPLAVAPGGAVDDSYGHYRSLNYDPPFHTYPTRETIHIGGGKEDLTVEATYDPAFNVVTSATDFNGHLSSYGYDTLGRLVSIRRPGDTPESPSNEYIYNLAVSFGDGSVVNFIETRLLDGAPGSRQYFLTRTFVDGLGRELMTKEEAGTHGYAVKEAVWFNARAQTAAMLQPFFSSTFDFENVLAANWEGEFHAHGNLVPLDIASAQKTLTKYDGALREMTTVNPDATQSSIHNEPLLTKSYDENDTDEDSAHKNTPMVHLTDGLGRLVRVQELVQLNDDGTFSSELETWTTEYTYRADDLVTLMVDSQGNQRKMQYDGLKRKTLLNDPDRGTMSYRYDAASNLIESVDAKGQYVIYSYDGANRLLSEDYLDASGLTPDVLYHYDGPSSSIPFGNGESGTADNTKGLLSCVHDLSGEEHTSYDERGRMKWTVKSIPDQLSGTPTYYKTAMTYDPADRLVDLTYPDGDRCTYEYNLCNRVARITGGGLLNADGISFILTSIEYLPSGQIAKIGYGNGVITEYRYDNRLRLSELKTARAVTPESPIINYTYHFDSASNITGIDDLRPSLLRPAGDKRRNTQRYQYDDLYRLTNVQYSFAPPGQSPRNDGEIRYRYDRIGNMLAETSDIEHFDESTGLPVTNLGNMTYGSGAGAWNRVGRALGAAPGPHALTGANNDHVTRSYPYDGNGNMTSIDGFACEWDFKDRLVAVESASMRAEYSYDYSDRRISKKIWAKKEEGLSPVPSSATVYVNRYFEIDPSGQPTKYVFDGKTRIARITGTLDESAKRVQRCRVVTGWNLLSVVVEAHDTADQLGIDTNHDIIVVYRWNPATGDNGEYIETHSGDPMPRGTVFWLLARSNVLLQICGDYDEPLSNPVVTSDSRILSSAALLSLLSVEALPEALDQVWVYNNDLKVWQGEHRGLRGPLYNMPDFVPVGSPIAVHAFDNSTVLLPVPRKRIQYFHQDHLGSTNIVTDGDADVEYEVNCYPFGYIRTEYVYSNSYINKRPEHIFTQKERDRESSLDYFDTRFYSPILARFISVDTLGAAGSISSVTEPAKLNCYSYVENNPLAFVDPTGEQPSPVGLRLANAANLFRVSRTPYVSGRRWRSEEGFFKFDKTGSEHLQSTPGLDCTGLIHAALSRIGIQMPLSFFGGKKILGRDPNAHDTATFLRTSLRLRGYKVEGAELTYSADRAERKKLMQTFMKGLKTGDMIFIQNKKGPAGHTGIIEVIKGEVYIVHAKQGKRVIRERFDKTSFYKRSMGKNADSWKLESVHVEDQPADKRNMNDLHKLGDQSS